MVCIGEENGGLWYRVSKDREATQCFTVFAVTEGGGNLSDRTFRADERTIFVFQKKDRGATQTRGVVSK